VLRREFLRRERESVCLHEAEGEAPLSPFEARDLNLAEGEPTEAFRFGEVRFALGGVASLHKKADVEVFVGGYVASGGNRVDVDVEEVPAGKHVEVAEAGLFANFTERRVSEGAIQMALHVPAGLQPDPQLAVPNKKDVLVRRIRDQCGSGDVSEQAATVERVMGTRYEGTESCHM
jgi:hypothetical protein